MGNCKRITFRWFFCIVGLWTIQAITMAQISEGGIPPSFQFHFTLRSRAATIQVPVTFNASQLKMADEQKAAQGAPLLAVATLIDVNYNPTNSGVWSMLPDGNSLWQLNIQAKGAIALMVYYADFYIPEGGRLFIYNAAKTQILGAYTQRTYPTGGRFATEFVIGDDITLEYVAAPGIDMPRIDIEAIGYGYNHLSAQSGSVVLRRASGSCEVNINCEEGDAWQNQKKGVCSMTQRIGNTAYLCTGSLMNNTAMDLQPYILTAQHCACDDNGEASSDDMNQWIFYFNYELEGCNNSATAVTSKSIVGCRKVAATTINKESDGLLLLANTPIPADYNVYYNGWDRRDTPANSGVSIHHPQGDYKKISTFYSPAIHYTLKTSDGYTGDTNAHWCVFFDETLNGFGVTEDGSSGSPLFNENKLIVGTLSGGNSSCTYPEGVNLYGKMSYHWDKYKNDDSTRLDRWLDPVNSGVGFLNGRFHQDQIHPPTNLKVVFQNQTVVLTWEAPASAKPVKYYVFNNNLRIGESTGLTYTDSNPQYGMRTYSVSAVYEEGNESEFVSTSIEIIEYKAPEEVSVTYISSQQQVAVQWEPPYYEQTIYWGESNAMYQVTVNISIPFYFGQRWTSNFIQPLHRKTITAVKFIPIRNNSYDIYITQGGRTYRQEVTDVIYGQTNTIPLDNSFVIDGGEDLIVALHVTKQSSATNEYPAVCDGGPAVQGRGDIYSFDGQNWSSLYDENDGPDALNYNFFLAAVVCSIEKDLPLTTSSTNTRSLTSLWHATPQNGQNNLLKVNVDLLRYRTLLPAEISLRSYIPSAFPEATGYYIYRDNMKIATVGLVPRRFLDHVPVKKTIYQVSALYGTYEGQLSDSVSIMPMGNLPDGQIVIGFYPRLFTNQIELMGHEWISKVEVFAATGQLMRRIDKPDNIIHTESLRPGVYFFRFYTETRDVIVLRGVRK